jgi:hypothetical protein
VAMTSRKRRCFVASGTSSVNRLDGDVGGCHGHGDGGGGGGGGVGELNCKYNFKIITMKNCNNNNKN